MIWGTALFVQLDSHFVCLKREGFYDCFLGRVEELEIVARA